jgi:hypothetical protein
VDPAGCGGDVLYDLHVDRGGVWEFVSNSCLWGKGWMLSECLFFGRPQVFRIHHHAWSSPSNTFSHHSSSSQLCLGHLSTRCYWGGDGPGCYSKQGSSRINFSSLLITQTMDSWPSTLLSLQPFVCLMEWLIIAAT